MVLFLSIMKSLLRQYWIRSAFSAFETPTPYAFQRIVPCKGSNRRFFFLVHACHLALKMEQRVNQSSYPFQRSLETPLKIDSTQLYKYKQNSLKFIAQMLVSILKNYFQIIQRKKNSKILHVKNIPYFFLLKCTNN